MGMREASNDDEQVWSGWKGTQNDAQSGRIEVQDENDKFWGVEDKNWEKCKGAEN